MAKLNKSLLTAALFTVAACAPSTQSEYSLMGMLHHQPPMPTLEDPGCHHFINSERHPFSVLLPGEIEPRSLLWGGTRCPQKTANGQSVFVSQRQLVARPNTSTGVIEYSVSLGNVGPNRTEVWCRGRTTTQIIGKPFLDCSKALILGPISMVSKPFAAQAQSR